MANSCDVRAMKTMDAVTMIIVNAPFKFILLTMYTYNVGCENWIKEKEKKREKKKRVRFFFFFFFVNLVSFVSELYHSSTTRGVYFFRMLVWLTLIEINLHKIIFSRSDKHTEGYSLPKLRQHTIDLYHFPKKELPLPHCPIRVWATTFIHVWSTI